MYLIDNPLTCLYLALAILIFFLILFKIGNLLEEYIAKKPAKEPKKKDSKEKATKVTESKEKETKKEVVEEKKVAEEKSASKVLEDLPGDDKNNYLYDRFVLHPTRDDHIPIKSISDTFITEKDLKEIRNAKTYIRVSPVQKLNCGCHISCDTQGKIESIINENRSARSKLLREFDGLSKEMKLLIIENIMKNID